MNSYSKTALAAAICTALSAGHAGAATFNVTNTDDSGIGSLRDALTQANANDEADIIDLSTVSGQTISITSGQLEIDGDDVTIDGANVTLDAGGLSRVLATYYSDVTLNDLTITGGFVQMVTGIGGGAEGGGILALETDLEINDSEISGNSSDAGGGLSFSGYYTSLAVNDSVVSGNNAAFGGGAYVSSYYGAVTFSGSQISSNTADQAYGGFAASSVNGDIDLIDSVVSGNSVTGGSPEFTPTGRFADVQAALAEQRAGSPWGNRGSSGGGPVGGAGLLSEYGAIQISRSTISGNSADAIGGIFAIAGEGSLLVDSSTISGNSAGSFGGAGVLRAKYDLQVRNSTISGNSSGDVNGGLVMYSNFYDQPVDAPDEPQGQLPRTLLMEFTTITGNSASSIGGLGLSSDIPLVINASVISGNTAPIDPDIGFEPAPDNANQADVSFSLVGVDSTSGTLNFDTTSASLLGQDPLLGPLAANGGPTFTHLPAASSPVVDVVTPGSVGCGDVVTSDQRGEPRPFNAGCEAGSVERGPDAPPPALAVPVMDRIGLLLMAGLLGLAGLLGFRRRSEQKF